MQSLIAPVYKIANENEENVADSVVRVAFMKLGYLVGVYIPTLRDKNLEKWYKNTRGVHKMTAATICY